MEPRTLSYWKQRQIDLRNCLTMTKPRSIWYAELCQAHRDATRKIEKTERRVLARS
jgi:hypothetical protein